MDLNLQDLKRIAEALEKHLELAKDDLAFRREQAAKGEAQQVALMQMFLPPNMRASQPSSAESTAIDSTTRRRPRHTEPV
jgi:hypothetical protein